MPRRLLRHDAVPTLVAERLTAWGKCVRKQRVYQRITALDLCDRPDISYPTLQGLERGEAGVGAAHCLAALYVLGVLEQAAPALQNSLWQMPKRAPRALSAASDEEYF